MSSTTNVVVQFDLITNYISAYGGLFVFLSGMIGNILNIIVFLSLKTFRKNPRGFCLFILSISESGMLLFYTLPNSFVNMFKDYGDVKTMFPCKLRMTCIQIFGLLSYIILCTAAIDQWMSTSIRKHRQGVDLKMMRRLIMIGIFISMIQGIPFSIFYDPQILPGTNDSMCRLNDNNGLFSKYVIYIHLPIVNGFLPITIMSIFAMMAFRNVRHMKKIKVQIIRLSLEQQLTCMVLTKILSVGITVVPFLIFYILRYTASERSSDIFFQKKFQSIGRFFLILFYINFADSFYIFLASSIRFRRQLKYVLFYVYLKQWRIKMQMNRVQPFEGTIIVSITDNNRMV